MQFTTEALRRMLFCLSPPLLPTPYRWLCGRPRGSWQWCMTHTGLTWVWSCALSCCTGLIWRGYREGQLWKSQRNEQIVLGSNGTLILFRTCTGAAAVAVGRATTKKRARFLKKIILFLTAQFWKIIQKSRSSHSFFTLSCRILVLNPQMSLEFTLWSWSSGSP